MLYPDRIRRFPWPFTADRYAYTANVEPAPALRRTAVGAWGQHIFDIDDGYGVEIAERRAVLARDPSRHVALPHMQAASWDAMLWSLQNLAATDPAMTLQRGRQGSRLDQWPAGHAAALPPWR